MVGTWTLEKERRIEEVTKDASVQAHHIAVRFFWAKSKNASSSDIVLALAEAYRAGAVDALFKTTSVYEDED